MPAASVFSQEPAAEAEPVQAAAEEAQPGPVYDTGHVAWMMVCSALVLMMTGPGLALFYGGLVRKKNILSVMMQCLFLMGMNSVLWAVVGYSLAFSDQGPTLFSSGGKDYSLIGGLDKAFLQGVGPHSGGQLEAAGDIPEELFMVFQMMFFIITPALIAGAFAERMRFSAMIAFTVLWGLVVYCPLAHWVWGPNAIFGEGGPCHALDFAGGLVVHASSGISALVCALILGKRIGYGKEPIPPHNLTYTVIGSCLLWVGWFGFNAGSALAANESAVNAFVVTHLCAAAGLLGWACAEWFVAGKPSVLGACSGLVAGLVVITPASGFVTPMAAIVMGLLGGGACYIAAVKVKIALGYDDSLDAFGVHGVGGSLGAILTGVFASSAVKSTQASMAGQVTNQVISLVVTYLLSIVGTVIILKVIDATIGLRVSKDSEMRGLDVTEHNEEGYIFQ
jgi:Amt family ammonium transporter